MGNKLGNIPQIKLALVAVSRDCFPMSLSEARRDAVAKAYAEKYSADDLFVCPTVIENELDMRKALGEINGAGCNALVVLTVPPCMWLPPKMTAEMPL